MSSPEPGSTALARIPVGVVVERRKADSPWQDFLYRPVAVLEGVPVAAPWTVVGVDADVTTFFAGQAVIELYRTETANYRDNLASGRPRLWVVLRPMRDEAGFDLFMVTADPAEGEALTGAGNDLVEAVSMPPPLSAMLASFHRCASCRTAVFQTPARSHRGAFARLRLRRSGE